MITDYFGDDSKFDDVKACGMNTEVHVFPWTHERMQKTKGSTWNYLKSDVDKCGMV